MPKKPKNYHPLRTLRTVASLTQSQLATRLGVSSATVQSIELGRLEMSSELALKISHQFGCALATDKKKNGYAITAKSADTLKAYTKQDYLEHQESMKNLGEWEFENLAEAAATCIDLLFRIAIRQDMRTTLSIAQDFELFIAKVFRDYDLKKFLIAEFRDEWVPFNKNFPLETQVNNFPVIPLKVAASLERKKAQKVMPK